MMVRNCVAHDGQRAPIQLVDERGCVTRPKIMSPFKKVKNFDATANVLAFAYFQAFKFPDSMNVHFQCVVQVSNRFFKLLHALNYLRMRFVYKTKTDRKVGRSL